MKRKNAVVFALSGALLTASFALPGAVTALRDSAIESRAEYVSMDEAELRLISSLDAEEKLRIAGDGTAAVISLDSGIEMDENKAAEAALTVLDFDSDWTVEEISPRLLVSGDGKSFVLWQAVVDSFYGSATLMLDDETGALLGFSVRYGEDQEESTDPAAKEWSLYPGSGYLADGDRGEIYAYGSYAASISPEDYIDISRAVLDPLGLTPLTLTHTADGALIYVEDSDLTIRITVTGEGTGVRLNMG